MDEIEEIIRSVDSPDLNFSDYVEMLRDTGTGTGLKEMFYGALNMLTGDFYDMKSFLIEIIAVVVIASIFVNISKVYKNRQVSETGFYITYMLMFMLLAVSFGSLHAITRETMEKLLGFMQALVPAFFLTVSYIGGNILTASFYQEALLLITVVEALLVKICLPFINVFFVFSVVNPILGEDLFSNMLDLMERIVIWGMKTLLAIVMGVGVIQGIVAPFSGTLKLTGRMGGIVSGVVESVLGAGAIIKNAVGAAGLFAIVVICIYPVMKLGIYSLLFQLGAAISQPVSGDKRMSACMTATFRATKLLLMVLTMSAALFMVTLAVVTIATGR